VPRPDYYGNPAGLTNDIDVVRAIYVAFARRDVEGALAYVAPDCVFEMKGTAERIGRTEPYRGHAGLREYFADVARSWESLTLAADDFRAIPGSVIVLGHVEGRMKGEAVRRNAVWTWRVENGLATHAKVADTGPAADED
jgi:ketosteroid isomerase-like protein